MPPTPAPPDPRDATRERPHERTPIGTRPRARTGRALALAFGLLLLVAVQGLAGCGGIPRYVPDVLPGQATPLAVTDGHGPLSPARRQAVLDRLRAASPGADVLGRHLAIEEAITGAPLTAGNRVTLLRDGPQTYEAMFSAVASARQRIEVETYILDDDEVGRRFADALIARRRDGIDVVLMHDGVGTLHTPAAFFRRLSDAGIAVREFNPVNPLKAAAGWQVNQRDHRKLLVVDGGVAILGGVNISGVYGSPGSGPHGGSSHSGAGWRDTDVRVEGPAAAELEALFHASWATQGPPLADHAAAARGAASGAQPVPRSGPPTAPLTGAVVRAVGSGPEDPYGLMFSALLSAIDSAETSVHLTNAYFVPDPQLVRALQDAVQRGVDVAVVVPAKTDSWLVTRAARAGYEQLLAAGVHLHERRGAMLHAKTAVIDGVWATVGSTNLDWRSALHNHELDAIVLGPEFGAQMEALFREDLAQSEALTLYAWRRRAWDERLGEWFASWWAYWL